MHVDEKTLLRLLADEPTQRKAFEMLLCQYSQPLYRQIRRIVMNHDDANDVLQNVFLKVWQKISSFEGRSKLSSWLYRIAINEALDFMRKAKQNIYLSSEAAETKSIAAQLLADEFFDGNEAEALLQQALQELPDMQRTVFQLKYYEDMKYSEISEILQTSEGALKASYHLAVKKISHFLEDAD